MISIIMPALNEEKNISSAIDDVLAAFKQLNISGEIIVINDGSSDSTPALTQNKIKEHPDAIKIISHDKPQGIGSSFWDGVDLAPGETVCMLPGDNENDPYETLRYLKLMNDVDMVIPFVVNKTTRSKFRNWVSSVYLFIINSAFGMSLNYTNGTVIYKKSVLKSLNYRAGGFFYQTDILVRLIKKGYLYAEVPYRLRTRLSGKSKATSLRSLKAVTKGFLKLAWDIYSPLPRGQVSSGIVSNHRDLSPP